MELNDTLDNIEINESQKIEDQKSAPSTSVKSASSSKSLLVNFNQRGNPALKAVTNVPWEYSSIVPDYEMGHNMCAIFLTIKYHNLNPDHIHNRLKQLGKMYDLRVLLVLIDSKDPHHVIKNLTRICILADMTLILAWSFEEAGKILEQYKIYENKPPESIMEKSESSPYLMLIQALSSIKPVNKTDAMTLVARFKTLKGILSASEQQIADCPGFGARKAKKLFNTLHESFCR